MEGTRLMTVRGFLAWYLGTVAMVSASGAVMWHGIQSRRHVDTATVMAPQPPATPAPPQAVAEAGPQQPVAAPSQPALPKLQAHQSPSAALPVPPLRPTPPADHTTRVASRATQPWSYAASPRPAAKAAARAPRYQPPPPMPAQAEQANPGYGPGPYVVAYPPAEVAPWQMPPYAYRYYYPYRRYYVRYPR